MALLFETRTLSLLLAKHADMTKIGAHMYRFSTGNRTEWSTIQGVNVAFGRFEITSPITSELYDTKSCY